MKPNNTTIDRRTYIAATGAATAGIAGLAGCVGGDGLARSRRR